MVMVAESARLSADIRGSAAVVTSTTIAAANADTDAAVVAVDRLCINRLNIRLPHIDGLNVNGLNIRRAIDRSIRISRCRIGDSATVASVTMIMLRGSGFAGNKRG